MRAIVVAITVVLLLGLPGVAHAFTYYRAIVTSTRLNTYREEWSGATIYTNLCSEVTNWDEAVLIWDGRGSLRNRLVFSNGARCDVTAVYGAALYP